MCRCWSPRVALGVPAVRAACVGLTLTTATDVVIFAIACMGLNILVGHTGLVSFGHGAFFGLAAYAAALSQRHWFPGDIVIADAVRDRCSSRCSPGSPAS